MLTLGIESSCDETAVAIVDETGQVFSDTVHSQIKTHAEYGGVVPELASRDHLRNIVPVYRSALEKAGKRLEDVQGIAVTCRPGLSGALLVGTQMAQGLAWGARLPLVGVDHLIGHLLAVFLREPGAPKPDVEFPFLGLLVSGGHTAIYSVHGPNPSQIRELGATRDDAAGEAYDKVAKLTGLGYPGGPIIDKLAAEGNAAAIKLARPMRRKDSLEFSFSGLKTDVARWVKTNGLPGNTQQLRDLCASFQTNVVETLLSKAFRAAQNENLGTVVIAGGVAANRQLRERAAEYSHRFQKHLVLPPIAQCTDNAAMIAYAGAHRLAQGHDDTGHLTMSPRTSLESQTRKGPGRR